MGRIRYEQETGEIFHLGKSGQPKGATVVFGGQAGSEGKGAIGGWLARRFQWGAAVCTFMPNAGHTFVAKDEEPVVVRQLPIGLVSETVGALMIGASAVIKPELLQHEIEMFDARGLDVGRRLSIHPRAQIMLPEYEEWEAENLKYIASTGKGCGAAIAAKARREQGVILAEHAGAPAWIRTLVDYNMDITLNNMINDGHGVLVEQSQGYDLDINHGYQYPYCTSRQRTPTQIMADIGVSERMVTNSIAVIRTHPIRVGNVPGGTSGGYGTDELSWGDVSHRAGREVEERTTVTQRVRRVFEFDFERITTMSRVCRPTCFALTFADYIDPDIKNYTHEEHMANNLGDLTNLSPKLERFIYKVQNAARRGTFNPKVLIAKTGPNDEHTIDIGFAP